MTRAHTLGTMTVDRNAYTDSWHSEMTCSCGGCFIGTSINRKDQKSSKQDAIEQAIAQSERHMNHYESKGHKVTRFQY